MRSFDPPSPSHLPLCAWRADMGCTDAPLGIPASNAHSCPVSPRADLSFASTGSPLALYHATKETCRAQSATCDGSIVEQPVNLWTLTERLVAFGAAFIRGNGTKPAAAMSLAQDDGLAGSARRRLLGKTGRRSFKPSRRARAPVVPRPAIVESGAPAVVTAASGTVSSGRPKGDAPSEKNPAATPPEGASTSEDAAGALAWLEGGLQPTAGGTPHLRRGRGSEVSSEVAPWFLYVALTEPHTPHTPRALMPAKGPSPTGGADEGFGRGEAQSGGKGKKEDDLYKRLSKEAANAKLRDESVPPGQVYWAAIKQADQAVKGLCEALSSLGGGGGGGGESERPDRFCGGPDANTLTIVTSDNGPWRVQGAFGGSGGPFRGGEEVRSDHKTAPPF